MAGLVISLTLVAIILMGGTVLSQLSLYVLSTLLAGALAALVAKYVLDTESGAPGVEQDKDEPIT